MREVLSQLKKTLLAGVADLFKPVPSLMDSPRLLCLRCESTIGDDRRGYSHFCCIHCRIEYNALTGRGGPWEAPLLP